MPQRVALLYRGVRLGAELLALLSEDRQVDVISSPIELAKGRPPADVVVIDVPAPDRRAVCAQVRRHYRGLLVVLLDAEDNGRDLPPDPNRTLLARPFSMRQLSVALAVPAFTQPSSNPAGVLRLIPPQGARSSELEPDPDRGPATVGQGVLRRVRGWRDRRLVRVSAISVMAAVAFLGAFAVMYQGDRCGPGCEELTGTDLSAPSSTAGSADLVGPDRTGSGTGTVDPTTSEPSVDSTADTGVVAADDGGAAPVSSSTAWPNEAPTATSPPDPTQPPSSAPPTTAPTTTRPKPTTSTTRATTTTTTPTTTTSATTTSTTTGP
jgi:hypothetical protein